MPYLTLGEAAKSAGRTKPTILNAIKKGRVSAKKDDKGQWQIDPAELHRVYPAVSSNSLKKDKTLRLETPSNTNGSIALEKEIELLRERLKDKDGIIADLREDRNHWREQAERASLLLTDMRPKKKTALDWLFGINRARRGE